MASQISRIFPLLVITLCCIGAVEGGYSVLEYLLFRNPAQEATQPGGMAEEQEKTAQVPGGTKRDYQIILTRNLFGQQYKSEDTQPTPTVDVSANLEKSDREIVLVGTIGGSEGHRAIILDKKTKKQDLYKEGDEIKGANVKEILRGKVILDVQGREELLDMSEAATVRPVAKAPQEAPSAPQPVPGANQAAGQSPASRPELRGEREVSVTTEAAPAPEEAPTAAETPPAEPPEENSPEATAPEQPTPEVLPETVPQAAPEATAPTQEQGSSGNKIVRPRIIRPYRSQ